jgi:peptide/nickel transport system ATP-binding protein
VTEPIPAPPASPAGNGAQSNGDALLRVTGLVRHFPVTRGVVFRHQVGAVRAVDGIDLSVSKGQTLGLVGESGCGKSTVARLLVGLYEPTRGRVVFDGLDTAGKGRPNSVRRRMQMIFQDPYASLNPRKTIGTIIGTPFRLHGTVPRKNVKTEVQQLMELVGLNPEHYNRYPHEFSGGQRQRIGIARALALNPKLIIADEPTTALDATVQAQILDLLVRLQREYETALIMITHDLGVIADIADEVLVMYAGRAAEKADKHDIFYQPHHPYTKGLLESIPNSSAAGDRLRPITGQPPNEFVGVGFPRPRDDVIIARPKAPVGEKKK